MSNLKKIVKPQHHQSEAVEQLDKSNSIIAYHGLGSGKTLTSILAAEEAKGPKLILAPASLLGNYRKELKKFNVDDKDYHLLSYERFRKNPEHYIDKIKPSIMIADEFHRTQNVDSITGEAIRRTRPKVKKFMGLTGTIAQNRPSEIGSLVNTATGQPLLGKDENEFNQRFVAERRISPGIIGRLLGRRPGVVEEAKNLDKFKKITQPYVNTFAGDEEYMKHIPKVTRNVVRIPMNKEQNRIYDYTFNDVPAWIKFKIKNNLPPSKQESRNLNAFLLGSRQASNSLQPFGEYESTPKLRAVVHDIESGIKGDPNFKGVVYSNFLEAGLKPLASKLKKHNIPYGMFTGEQPDVERNQMVQDYNKGKLKSLLISPAGGEGLDLRGTKYMGILDPGWNPAKTEQAIGRAARFKSHEHLPENERTVTVKQYLSEPRLGLVGKIKKIFRPDTHAIGTDEYIYNRAQEKARLNQQFTNALKAPGVPVE
jgi:hypothetical protein